MRHHLATSRKVWEFLSTSLNVDPVDLLENVFLDFVLQSQRPVVSVRTIQHQKACQGRIYSILKRMAGFSKLRIAGNMANIKVGDSAEFLQW